MKLSSIRIVLVATSHPGNIGSTARAMKTMGLNSLYLVNPKSFPDYKAKEMAAGADDVLEQAVVTSSLEEALAGCQLILATSARPRGLSLPGLLPVSGAELIGKQADNTQVAIVFGREHAGLTNEELLKCHYHINIPSNPDYSSLNLAQAVQIVAYEIRMNLLSPKAEVSLRRDEYATADEIEQFYDHLKDVFIEIQFLKTSNPRRLMQRVRRLFNRVILEKMEVSILRGMLSQVQKSLEWAEKGKRRALDD
ncbi:MAG: tRNA (cytosine(32)/uridine(32)-2'-O)-methyltransferase TrmJ [Gammaproteobacteria bacterium]|nr:tRNA (cytosine(32)/uridine(32)-2'-O)-methyltransferase TrmJ [Gammaproteobacteria bacterium]